MKRIILAAAVVMACFASAQAVVGSEMNGQVRSNPDTTRVMSLEEIIAQESMSKYEKDNADRRNSIWGKNTYLNLAYSLSHKMSSDEFPSKSSLLSAEYEPKFGVALQWGHTFNFHKKPIGNVLFIGLDYTWMDAEFNQFDQEAAPAGYEVGEQVRCLPWHNKKMTISYGMNIGPSLTFYPFTSLNKSGADNIRLQLYFHVGYNAELAWIKEAIIDGGEYKDGYAIGHGLYTAFGGNLSWNFIGVGYEIRNDNKLKFKATDDKYKTGTLEMKEETSRVYLQFRF